MKFYASSCGRHLSVALVYTLWAGSPCMPLAPPILHRRLLVDSHLECWSRTGWLFSTLPTVPAACPPVGSEAGSELGQSERFTDLVLWARTILEHRVDSSVLPDAQHRFLNSSASSSSNPINRLVITNQKLLLLRLNGFYIHLSLFLSLFPKVLPLPSLVSGKQRNCCSNYRPFVD